VKYSTLENQEIKLNIILQIAKEFNITFQKGDILFVRTGFTKQWDTTMTAEVKKSYSENPAKMQYASKLHVMYCASFGMRASRL
jgi:kynurenine formamidase